MACYIKPGEIRRGIQRGLRRALSFQSLSPPQLCRCPGANGVTHQSGAGVNLLTPLIIEISWNSPHFWTGMLIFFVGHQTQGAGEERREGLILKQTVYEREVLILKQTVYDREGLILKQTVYDREGLILIRLCVIERA